MCSKRLLVIDDDVALQKLFGLLLRRAGFETDFAADGAEGFAMLERTEYDTVILDLMMPKMTGFDVLRELGARHPEMLHRVIVTSGASQRMIDQVDTSTIYGLIRKPFDINNLVSATLECAANHGA
jgi:DNA-binding response OmpR family regulator